MTYRTLFLILCAATTGLAQDASVAGPVAGYVFDPALHAIRPMLGVPGAAYLGAAVVNDVDAAAIAPDGASALVSSRGRVYRVSPLRAAATSEGRPPRHAALLPLADAVDGAIDGVNRIVWSGDEAALYSSTSGQAQILSSMTKRPAAGAVLDLSSLPGPVTSMSVNGDTLFAGVASAGIYRLSAGNAPQLLAPARYPVGLRIVDGALYFADRDAGEIWQIANSNSGSTPVRFAGGLDTPVALHVGAGRIYAASAGGRKLAVYDLATHTPGATLDLAFTPVSLDPMGSASLLLMATGQPFYVLDTSPDPAVYFVPEKGIQQ